MLHLDRHTLSLAVTQPCEQADNFEVCLCIYVVPTTCTCPMQPAALLFLVHRMLMKSSIKVRSVLVSHLLRCTVIGPKIVEKTLGEYGTLCSLVFCNL